METLTLPERDLIVKWLKSLPPDTIRITEPQSDKIKQVWQLLHWFDDKHYYTISQDNTKLRKDRIWHNPHTQSEAHRSQ